jgi:solute carrier family 50 protein (sugar transporter)
MLTALTSNKAFVTALKSAGPAFFMGMQATSVQTAMGIMAKKSVGQLAPLPFVSLLTNCVIWTYYGILKSDKTVLIPNFFGVLAGAFCVQAFHRNKGSTSLKNLYLGAGTLIAASTALAATGNAAMLGYLGCAISVVMMGSPLAVMGTVIKTKSTAALPFATSAVGWVNTLSWTSYGALIAKDPMVSSKYTLKNDIGRVYLS